MNDKAKHSTNYQWLFLETQLLSLSRTLHNHCRVTMKQRRYTPSMCSLTMLMDRANTTNHEHVSSRCYYPLCLRGTVKNVCSKAVGTSESDLDSNLSYVHLLPHFVVPSSNTKSHLYARLFALSVSFHHCAKGLQRLCAMLTQRFPCAQTFNCHLLVDEFDKTTSSNARA